MLLMRVATDSTEETTSPTTGSFLAMLTTSFILFTVLLKPDPSPLMLLIRFLASLIKLLRAWGVRSLVLCSSD